MSPEFGPFGPTALPGGIALSSPSTTGNRLWQLTVFPGPVRLSYETLDDALVDYIFRLNAVDEKSTHGISPRRYRATYGRLFWPIDKVEHLVTFHDTIPEALAEIQAGEKLCNKHPSHFTMQGTGIHRYNSSARRYIMEYDASDASALLAEVRRRLSTTGEAYDLFISHASEDKDSLVRPLAESLRDLGLSVWYDEFELRPGDSLRQSLDRGIATSRHGLVVLSPAFIRKNWTQWELNGIINRLMAGDAKLIPLWYDIPRSAVAAFSPSIADIIAIVAADKGIGQVASEVVRSLDNH
ncbi:toll/interleukin-1 receptor domain-containing protein [Solwaraspora sp. WMMD1047]|uniref:toll/interleukin-1 receptor domain-containing protein n=1 Tax=Solwaraspora sp. WMMD1047 TaxID=3016102 RepID=UPI0024163647|nr:toll/interleukin-1 receptor domain-containing protein [Solwaraspora sp. WMMD1047]MDG4834234.1 toll/interleukin-1 receptor domain-containing protein [Solwaraspora sp. WMMD1047]